MKKLLWLLPIVLAMGCADIDTIGYPISQTDKLNTLFLALVGVAAIALALRVALPKFQSIVYDEMVE